MNWKRMSAPIDSASSIEKRIRAAAAGQREDAAARGQATNAIAVFVSNVVGESMVYYFAPDCGAWADDLIDRYGGGPCEVPGGRWLTRISGDQESWSLLPDLQFPARLR